jgi:glycine hydroxymethyltransferase
MQGGPLMQVTAAKAICFKEAMSQEFKDYAHQIVKNCKTLADVIMKRGFRLVSGGTDNHLLLVDVAAAGLTGKVAAAALDETGIIVNKYTIPFDKNSPFATSGIRIGTATAATRGMKEPDMEFIGDKICTVLENIDDVELRTKIRAEVAEFASKFMVP